jgi:3-deoxy-manno-octulosonate cytidylyltransferase (CMP-KDO synthetase)
VSGIIGAIPARYGSTRLPGKVLREIAGRPMIEHVYERARRAEGLSGVVVLTDDERVAEAVEGFGGIVEMTPADCASGTDRIAWAARSWRAQAVVNIQGDEPMIEPEAIARVARHLAAHPDDEMVTLAAPAATVDLANPNVVKVVTGLDGRALYFSRAPIPFRRDGAETPRRAWRHIGIYGYQRETLLQLAALEPTPLERAESLEQLRALENGVGIRVLEIESGWPGVDTMDDLETVEGLLSG